MTQNRGTLGGNIANASPAADSPPLRCLVYDAQLEHCLTCGVSTGCPTAGFHSGYKQMDLRGDELIRRIRVPRMNGNLKQHYRKVGTRRAQAISKVCFAAAARMEAGKIADVRLAFGSVAPIVFRAYKANQSGAARRKPFVRRSARPREKISHSKLRPLTTSAPPRATAAAWRRIFSPSLSESLSTSH